MTRSIAISFPLLLCLLLAGCGSFRPDRALRVATGTAAHDLCSETFVSGLDPDQTFEENLAPRPGMNLLAWAMRYTVDSTRRQVSASLAGAAASRAVFRDGLGCILVHGDESFDAPAINKTAQANPLMPEIAGPAIVEPAAANLKAAFDTEFIPAADKRTKAVVVLHQGRVIGERYAAGYGVDTPILGFSISKSVVNALVGILVREARLSVDAPAPVKAWQNPADPRKAITIEHLSRMNSGLDLDETGSGFDPSNHMFYDEPDMAAFAVNANLKAAPGSRWAYSSGSTHILARIIRDTVGGNTAAAQSFAFKELFHPLGMRNVTMETDATGTPVGVHYMLASARDWARFGNLYLEDGVAGGKRILPEGWTNFSATPSGGTTYGAGWWTNRVSREQDDVRRKGLPVMASLPADTYYALGNLGQFIAVIPSERLVVVRMGRAHKPNFDMQGFEQLVAAAIVTVRQSR